MKLRTVRIKQILGLVLLVYASTKLTSALAAEHTVTLNVQYKQVNFTGASRKAITINHVIPAPTLHFKDGDTVTINVHNNLDEETALHWHGLIVPWQMDGVLGITQKGIPPGGVFQYRFKLYQSGTYWYHAHAGLQEQRGLYGAFLIDPKNHPKYKYNKDYVMVLSDWSDTNPDNILANLKKDGEYYSPRFPLQASLVKFLHDYHQASKTERNNLISDYKMMQQMRMGLYDLSDVAYDTFLLNGHTSSQPWTRQVKIGDTVRLRFIGAGGSTVFNVKIPGNTMKMVHVQGNDVVPYTIDSFKISPGETYDVLVKIKTNKPYIIYAESIDKVGSVAGALITEKNQSMDFKKIKPFPEPLPVTRDMMSLMMSDSTSSTMNHKNHDIKNANTNEHSAHNKHMNHNTHQKVMTSVNTGMHHNMDTMNHMNMEMPTEPSIIGDTLQTPTESSSKTIGTKYQTLKAAVKTNDPNKPVSKIIKMELFGYMERYIWFINGVPEYKAHPIILDANKRYRFVFTNPSMMGHPMHIHGHWFILRNGHGSYDPLLHTINVPPGATVTADLDTDASGQWLFHCHLLYHMMSGMSRVFQYSSLIEITEHKANPEHTSKYTSYQNRPIVRVDKEPIDVAMIKHPMAHQMGLYLANFLDIGADPFNNSQKLSFKGLYGRDYDKLELNIKDAELDKGNVENADMDIFYWHLLSQFWAVKGGINYFYRPAGTPYWQPGIGIEGLLPYFIDTDLRGYYHSSSFKLDAELSRDTQITNNFFIRTGIRGIIASHTAIQAEIGNGLNQMRYTFRPYYRLMPGIILFSEYEHEQDYGSFKKIQILNNEPTTQDTVTLGLSILF